MIPEDIIEDLGSGDAARIANGIRAWREWNKGGDEFDMAPVGADLVRPLGDRPPVDVLVTLVRLLGSWSSFVPPPPRQDVLDQIVEIAIRYDDSQVAHEAAMELKSERDSGEAVARALGRLPTRGLASPREVEAAGLLVSSLLDGKDEVREATVAEMAKWPKTERWREVVLSVREQLSDRDRERLGV